MKKQFSLSVAHPCTEKWENFNSTATGNFCSSCSKNVVDFTKMAELEIIDFFKDNPVKTCGKFLPGQLKNYTELNTPSIKTGTKLFKAAAIALILMFLAKPGIAKKIPAQTIIETTNSLIIEGVKNDTIIANDSYIVKGVVKDEYDEVLPGVNILLKGNNIGVNADIDGYFEFPQPLQTGDVLIVSFIGFKRLEYKVPKKSEEDVIELVLVMDIEIMGEVAIHEVYQENTEGAIGIWLKVRNWF